MKVRYAPRARTDIARIHQHIAERNPSAARAVAARIRQTAGLIGRHPGLGRPTQIDEVRVIGTTRYPYLIYYRVDAAHVTIIHVRHGRRKALSQDDLK